MVCFPQNTSSFPVFNTQYSVQISNIVLPYSIQVIVTLFKWETPWEHAAVSAWLEEQGMSDIKPVEAKIVPDGI